MHTELVVVITTNRELVLHLTYLTIRVRWPGKCSSLRLKLTLSVLITSSVVLFYFFINLLLSHNYLFIIITKLFI